MKFKQGFTLIETTIVVVIILILFGVSIPFYSYFQNFSTMGASRQEIVEILREAQIKAQSGQNDSNWGVYFNTNNVILYQGASFVTRSQDQDQLFEQLTNVELSNLTEINFTKKTGTPNTDGTIHITNTNNQHIEYININNIGLIE